MNATQQQMMALQEVRKRQGPLPPGYDYYGIEDFLLQRGTVFEPQDLTLEEMELVFAAAKNKPFFFRRCFQNAQELVKADRSGKLIYVEGMASRIIAVHHAWVSLNGKVIDPTWLCDDAGKLSHLKDIDLPHAIQFGTLGLFGDERGYVGVPFPNRRRLWQKLRKTPDSLSLLDDWTNRYPLYKKGAYEAYLKD